MKEALKLAAGVSEIYVARGAKFVHFDMRKDKPAQDDLEKLILGPTGNLRAPAIIKGDKLLVGFNQEAYEKVLLN